jgi:hypothetical protein
MRLSTLMHGKEESIELRHDVVDSWVEKSMRTIIIDRKDRTRKVLIFGLFGLIFDGMVWLRVDMALFFLLHD